MNWSPDSLENLLIKKGFRLRGENMSRLEVFSDAAFALALTMLVVSVGTIPDTYNELIHAIKSIPEFGLSFIQIAFLWAAHRVWSRKYGLEDTVSTILTLEMILTILVYVYPLRLIFSSFFNFVTSGWLPSGFKVDNASQIANLFSFYGFGYATLTGIITLLHWHAGRKKVSLQLNKKKSWIRAQLFYLGSPCHFWIGIGIVCTSYARADRCVRRLCLFLFGRRHSNFGAEVWQTSASIGYIRS